MADPEVVSVINQFRSDLARRESDQFNAMADRWIELERKLEDMILLLAQEVAEQGSVPTFGQLQRLERYQALLRQMREEIRRYVVELVPIIEGEQLRYGQLGQAAALEALQALGVSAGFNTLPIEAIEAMVGLLGDGSPLSRLLMESWGDAADALTSILIQGTALGWNPRKTAREMRRAARSGLQRMLTIARTEQLRAYRSVALDSYRASGVVTMWKRIAARSMRTCVGCLAADGQVYPVETNFQAHPNCRCTTIPVILGRAETTWQTGPQWFAQQPEDVQRQILGPTRLQLLQSGAVNFSDFATTRHNPTWGDAIVPTPVEELTRRRRQQAA